MADPRERWDDLEEIIHVAIERHLAHMWTAIPVKLLQDSDGFTANLQPTIKGKFTDPETGETTDVQLPTLGMAPVQFASGGGFTITHPVKANDEGIAVFAARCIDAWWQNGGIQPQLEQRRHHLADSMYVPGIRSTPRKLNPPASTTSVQIRSDDGQGYVELASNHVVNVVAPGSINLTSKTGQSTTPAPTDGLTAACVNIAADLNFIATAANAITHNTATKTVNATNQIIHNAANQILHNSPLTTISQDLKAHGIIDALGGFFVNGVPIGTGGGGGGGQGPQGPQGPAGPQGPQGATGTAGNTVLNGTAAPVATVGNNGDFYLETSNEAMWGPKVSGAWPTSGVPLIGPQGGTGAPGATGATGPQGPQGTAGTTGATGSQGPAGATGPQGPQGTTGAPGATGPQGPTGNTGATGPQGPNWTVSTGLTLNTGTTPSTLSLTTPIAAAAMPALTGDVTSAAGSTATALAAQSGLTAGTYNNITVNGKGLATAGSNVAYVTGGPYLPLAGGTLTGNLTVPGIVGVSNGSNAAAGTVGEYLSSIVLTTSAISLTSGTEANVTSISLTAGDWDVWAEGWFNAAATTTITELAVGININSTGLQGVPQDQTAVAVAGSFSAGLARAPSIVIPTAPCRVSVSATTTYYLNVNSAFAVSTLAAYGKLCARRGR
jgi:hypothetical protein